MKWKRALIPPSSDVWCWVVTEKDPNNLRLAAHDEFGWYDQDTHIYDKVTWFWIIELPTEMPPT